MATTVGPLEAVQALYAGKQIRLEKIGRDSEWLYLNANGDIVTHDNEYKEWLRVLSFSAKDTFEVADRLRVNIADKIIIAGREFPVSCVRTEKGKFDIVAYSGTYGRIELKSFDLALAIKSGFAAIKRAVEED